jgi:hypothetical protein
MDLVLMILNNMKKYSIIFLLLIGNLLNATTYYVSTTGTDGAYPSRGTLANPWLTWQYAVNTAIAGDTVYFRGGVWYNTTSINSNPPSVGHDGTVSDPICFFNYPGEVPILNGINKTSPSPGLYFQNVDYVKVKGLKVGNNLQLTSSYYYASNFYFYQCTNITFENCISYNSGHRGFDIYECHGTVTFRNCDSYNNCDNLTVGYAGGGGDGYQVHDNNSADDLYTILYMDGCRAWYNSDDGFDIIFEGYAEIDSCWSFNNGYLDGEGDGFKYGWENITRSGVSRQVTNCMTAYNRLSAFDEGNNGYLCMNLNVYNNISYHDYAPYVTYTQCTGGVKSNVYRNNIYYRNTITDFGGAYTHSNNSWDIPITVTDADFISVDSTGITGARQVNGNLPDIDFLKLSSSSDLIGAGTDVGYGTDLGPFQYEEQVPAVDPTVIVVTSLYPNVTYALVTSSVTDDGGGTVSARGVCWGATADPTTADSHTTNGTGDGSFNSTLTPLTASTTYHVRAYATNEAGTAYSTDQTFQTLAETATLFVSSGGKTVTHLGKIVNNK